MQKFWYNSTVKFFKAESDFYDPLNPQNIQFFGSIKPIVLELGVMHRFLIPDYNTYVNSTEFSLYVIDEYNKRTQIACDVKTVNGLVKYITFQSDEALCGYLCLYDENNNPVYYSNCIQFINTEIFSIGVKHARIITKHNYNRQLFDFTEENAYFVTNLPMYEIGNYGMDAEISNERIGESSTLAPKETYLDEVTKYELKIGGNPDYVNFLQSSVTNTEFYINGTKRTSTEQMEVDDNNSLGKISFVNQKDVDGYNKTIDETVVLSDLNIVEVSRFPIDKSINTIANISLLNNRVSITFNKSFTIQPNKTAKIYKSGVLVLTKSSNDIDSDGRTLIINDTGINNSDIALTEGSYSVVLDAGIVRTGFGRSNLAILDWTFQISENTQYESFIEWIEGDSQDKVGNDTQVSATVSTGAGFVSTQWQYFDGSDFVDASSGATQNYIFTLQNGLNQFRNLAVDNNGVNYISNILKYTKSITPTLKSVTKINTNTAKFIWNNNNIEYGNGSSIFQYSTDNGLNWTNFYTAMPGLASDDNELNISSNPLSSLPSNSTVKFRIVLSGNGLLNQISNVIELIWQKTAKVYIPSSSVVKNQNGICQYQLHVEDAPFEGYVITQTEKVNNVRRISATFTNGETINSSTQDVTTRVKSITLQPNIYNCQINLNIIQEDTSEYSEGIATEYYSFTPEIVDNICSEYAINTINI